MDFQETIDNTMVILLHAPQTRQGRDLRYPSASCLMDPWQQISQEIELKFKYFY